MDNYNERMLSFCLIPALLNARHILFYLKKKHEFRRELAGKSLKNTPFLSGKGLLKLYWKQMMVFMSWSLPQ